MTNEKITSPQLFEIIARAAMVQAIAVTADTDIFETLGIDSLGIVEIFAEIDLKFGIKINPAALEPASIRTPGQILILISS